MGDIKNFIAARVAKELKNRYSQIQSAICECIKNNQS